MRETHLDAALVALVPRGFSGAAFVVAAQGSVLLHAIVSVAATLRRHLPVAAASEADRPQPISNDVGSGFEATKLRALVS